MLDSMPTKRISKTKEEDLGSNLVLFGLLLVLLLFLVTWWHISYKSQKTTTITTGSAIISVTEEEMAAKADINQDGKTDEKDAKLMKEAFLKNDIESLKADLNQDQKVDAKDYSLFNKILNSEEKETNAAE
jgi:hypothetical protein